MSTYIAGVGMTKFSKPSEGHGYIALGRESVTKALTDAGIKYSDLQQAYVGYSFGDSTSGQRVLYEFGQTGIPIVNVNNNCASGSSALYLARQAVSSGAAECVLALGFEQMSNGPLSANWTDRQQPLEFHVDIIRRQRGDSNAPWAAQWFGSAGIEYMQRYQISTRIFAEIAVKARKHAALNERAIFKQPITVEEVLGSPAVYGPLTRLQCCPPASGAAAAVVVSASFARKLAQNKLVRVVGQSLRTDTPAAFDGSLISLAGFDMARDCAQAVYEEAGIGPDQVDVVELHDCFTTNELIAYEGLGLTEIGEGACLVQDKDNTYGGRYVINPSGGLLSKGHPVGATGIAQCAELVWQLRGEAGRRQVPEARIGLQHNLGLGGACVVSMYQRVEQL